MLNAHILMKKKLQGFVPMKRPIKSDWMNRLAWSKVFLSKKMRASLNWYLKNFQNKFLTAKAFLD